MLLKKRQELGLNVSGKTCKQPLKRMFMDSELNFGELIRCGSNQPPSATLSGSAVLLILPDDLQGIEPAVMKGCLLCFRVRLSNFQFVLSSAVTILYDFHQSQCGSEPVSACTLTNRQTDFANI